MSSVKVSIIEYQGRKDIEGKAVGHAPKVLAESYEAIKNFCEVDIYCPPSVQKSLNAGITGKMHILEKEIVMKSGNSVYEKIANKFRMFANLKKAVKESDAEYLWFFNVEYYFFLYMAFRRRVNKKVIVTMYTETFIRPGRFAGIKNYFFEKALKKIDCIISTGEHFSFNGTKSIFIPDYYYDSDKYEQYRMSNDGIRQKKEKCICLGTMSSDKELEQLTEVFSHIDYPLEIAGRFFDRSRYENLVKKAGDNIVIKDEYLSEVEYFRLLADSKYVILPYSSDMYSNKTSGVLQEALFLDTIPVAYNKVLRVNSTPGIGIEDWSELNTESFKGDTSELLKRYEELRNTVYGRKNITEKYRQVFDK